MKDGGPCLVWSTCHWIFGVPRQRTRDRFLLSKGPQSISRRPTRPPGRLPESRTATLPAASGRAPDRFLTRSSSSPAPRTSPIGLGGAYRRLEICGFRPYAWHPSRPRTRSVGRRRGSKLIPLGLPSRSIAISFRLLSPCFLAARRSSRPYEILGQSLGIQARRCQAMPANLAPTEHEMTSLRYRSPVLRVAPLIAIADPGWSITTRAFFDRNPENFSGGNHGYDQWSADSALVRGRRSHVPARRRGRTQAAVGYC